MSFLSSLCFFFSSLSLAHQWGRIKSAVKAWSPFRVQFQKKTYPWVQLAGHEGEHIRAYQAAQLGHTKLACVSERGSRVIAISTISDLQRRCRFLLMSHRMTNGPTKLQCWPF